jgi:tetratricopeptide (TPR) repeat protein
MSGSDSDEVCASCGIASIDDVKLKKCACDLVKYCSDGCKELHRPEHEEDCKERLAELREDKLFRQPDESYLGECSICCLPLPIDENKSRIMPCCCKTICNGCEHANKIREEEQGLEQKCAYCREPLPETQEEAEKINMKRVKVNDPAAIFKMGVKCLNEEDYEGAVEYWTKAAELGDISAQCNLSIMYYEGKGVEKDKKKEVYHLEEAAIGGHPIARFNLGNHEFNNGRIDRSMRHFIIAAKLGCDKSLENVKYGFTKGVVSKEDYAAALRGHQAAVDATKSEQREEAYAFFKRIGLS